MKVEGVIWLDTIIEKLAVKHNVQPDEVEAVLRNNAKFRLAKKGDRQGEDVYLALGRTDTGRYLTVLFIYKSPKQALILSARDMADKERRMYGRK